MLNNKKIIYLCAVLIIQLKTYCNVANQLTQEISNRLGYNKNIKIINSDKFKVFPTKIISIVPFSNYIILNVNWFTKLPEDQKRFLLGSCITRINSNLVKFIDMSSNFVSNYNFLYILKKCQINSVRNNSLTFIAAPIDLVTTNNLINDMIAESSWLRFAPYLTVITTALKLATELKIDSDVAKKLNCSSGAHQVLKESEEELYTTRIPILTALTTCTNTVTIVKNSSLINALYIQFLVSTVSNMISQAIRTININKIKNKEIK